MQTQIRAAASGWPGWSCTTGAPSTSGSGRFEPGGRERAAHRRHRLRQVDHRGRRHHAAAAGPPHRLQQGRRGRNPGAQPALLRARLLQVGAQRGHRRLPAGAAAGRDRLLGASSASSPTPATTQTVTLAQVFWLKDGHQGQPDRFYVTAERDAVRRRRTSPTSAPTSLALRKRLRAARRPCARQLPRLRQGFPPPPRHRVRAGDGAVPPDGLDEVGRQPHRLRPRAHAGTVRRGRHGPRRSWRTSRT